MREKEREGGRKKGKKMKERGKRWGMDKEDGGKVRERGEGIWREGT